jgi:DNA adenine methylase
MENARYANIRPFLRWAGSKRRLLRHLIPIIPTTFNKYYEPFLGGGSLFFYIGPNKAEISDISRHLVDIYHSVRSSPDDILRYLKPLRPDREHFNKLKACVTANQIEESARLIFLNKTCWNGLFRVNSDGIFNVPFGMPKTNFIIDEPNFLRCSQQLRQSGVRILKQDFEAIENRVESNDFVFCDPPYVTSHNRNGFADWNERLFSWNDQIRLASMVRRLVRRGANVLITNADHIDVHALYQGFRSCTYSRRSTLASDAARRGVTSEAIFFGGPAYAHMISTKGTPESLAKW